MTVSVIDALLVLVLLAAVVYWSRALFGRSVPGIRNRQAQNRSPSGQESTLVCPVHGRLAESDLVRLPSGETLCPRCPRENHDAETV